MEEGFKVFGIKKGLQRLGMKGSEGYQSFVQRLGDEKRCYNVVQRLGMKGSEGYQSVVKRLWDEERLRTLFKDLGSEGFQSFVQRN